MKVVKAEVEHREGKFEGVGGLSLFEQSWRPKNVEPKAVIVMMHGLKDHSSRYAPAARQLVEHGYAVHAFDLRGHARSEGKRVFVKSFDEYLDDFGLFLERVRKQEGNRPLFLFGHSMGGAIVTLFTLTRKPDIRGLVLSGPALKVGADIPPALVKVTRVLGKMMPRMPVLKLEDSAFSRDPAVLAANQADPHIHKKPGPARTAAELLGALQKIEANIGELEVPVLAMHGSADTLTAPDGSKLLHEKARSTDKTLKLYPGLQHDLLNEPEKGEVFADMLAWLEARAGAPAARS